MPFILSCILCTSKKNNVHKKTDLTIPSFVTPHIPTLQPGDVILKRSYGPISNLIIKYLQEDIPVSHCGMVLSDTNGMFILHSISKEFDEKDGVQKTSLEKFFTDCHPNSVYVCRYKNKQQIPQVIEEANKYVNSNIPFDYDFNYLDKESMYCSELLFHIFQLNNDTQIFNTKFISNKINLLCFNSFLDTTHFEIVSFF